MFDRKLLAVIGCAVVVGLIAALMVSRYLSSVKAQSNTVVAASVAIPMSTQITADQLTLVHLPPEATPADAYTSIDKLVGRVTVVALGAKELVTDLKLAPEGSAAGLAGVITEGTRAMTVKVDDVVGVAGFVLPGAWVDIVAVVDPQEQGSNQGPTSKIVLQHIKVLASDRNIEKQATGETTMIVKAVTLEVLPDQAEKLALAATEGKLQLVLRNSVDSDSVQTPGVDKKALLGGALRASAPHVATSQMSSTTTAPSAGSVAAAISRGARPRTVPRSMIAPLDSIIVKEAANGASAGSGPPRARIELIEGSKRKVLEFQ
jgi:pilus assembly protein CpaB